MLIERKSNTASRGALHGFGTNVTPRSMDRHGGGASPNHGLWSDLARPAVRPPR
jgi:hypothetical protein